MWRWCCGSGIGGAACILAIARSVGLIAPGRGRGEAPLLPADAHQRRLEHPGAGQGRDRHPGAVAPQAAHPPASMSPLYRLAAIGPGFACLGGGHPPRRRRHDPLDNPHRAHVSVLRHRGLLSSIVCGCVVVPGAGALRTARACGRPDLARGRGGCSARAACECAGFRGRAVAFLSGHALSTQARCTSADARREPRRVSACALAVRTYV